MLTIFAVPKAFEGIYDTIQRNAVGSWKRLEPTCKIVLFGSDQGVADAADDLQVDHVPDVKVNGYGTPLLSDVFTRIARIATTRLVCYVNGDIILLQDFIAAIERIPFERFLMVGRRWDLDLDRRLDFSGPSWAGDLRQRAVAEGRLFRPEGIDYFVFPLECGLEALPDFAVGRPAWDNWMIARAHELRFQIVDATAATTVVHQNHGYTHVQDRRGPRWQGPEADANRELAGQGRLVFHVYTPLDATHVVTAGGVRRASGGPYCRARAVRFCKETFLLRHLVALRKLILMACGKKR